jgi:NADPH:quinone reductase-like Zn-dependent oxidoreductase
MRAVVIRQFGDPKLLQMEEVATPQPAEGDVLVQVKAAGINPSDVKNVAGTMHGTTLPRIPGRDFAGVVVKGPSGWLGREVWGTGGDVGFTRDGSHAEYIVLPPNAVAAKPVGLSMEEAGSAGLTFVTAWSAVVTAAAVQSGETVVIVGAAGGVGSAAVQIATARGAHVIGVVRSDNDIAAVQDSGAKTVVNAKTANVVETVRGLTGNHGAEVVFDSSGMMFAEAVQMAGMAARIPVISAPPDGKATFALRDLYRKVLRVDGVDTRRLDAAACAKLLDEMRTDFESGHLKVKGATAMPLERAVDAYEAAARGDGRVVLRMPG